MQVMIFLDNLVSMHACCAQSVIHFCLIFRQIYYKFWFEMTDKYFSQNDFEIGSCFIVECQF